MELNERLYGACVIATFRDLLFVNNNVWISVFTYSINPLVKSKNNAEFPRGESKSYDVVVMDNLLNQKTNKPSERNVHITRMRGPR